MSDLDKEELEETRKIYHIISPPAIFEFENLLNELTNKNLYMAKIRNINILYDGIREDTINGNREIFIVSRKID